MSKQTNKSVKMIDVGSKKVTKRVAVAEAFIHLNDSTKNKIYKNKIIKGDVISVAKTAGIVAAKKTSDIIVNFSNVTKQYGNLIVLDKLNLEIKKKDRV